MSSRKTAGRRATTKKRAQRATSNVFAMFDQAQIAEFKEAFNMIDQNHDGFIDKEDLHDMLASLAYFYPKDISNTSWKLCGRFGFMFPSWTNIRMRLCSARDNHAYVPHLIAAGLGTGFEERRDNETRSNSLDRLLHRSLSLGQCWGERPVATGTEGRPKGQGSRKTRLTVLLERVSSGYDLRELKSSSRNPRFTLAGSHAAGNCVVK
ncbi:Myosin regulatory light chain sqh [Trachymyrmex cornetzi]|uniref:Myosin regulatory light chain sqh n=1 Tax=Trachymyrmex cornetzi TaxID=471704 RepID=A0A195EFA9_9HYME|nr:Myosin regulatory light chain sqh [Trachymyrmex cornetzi]